MADRATGINPDILRWAREQAGYPTVEAVAVRLKRPATQIKAWESGSEFPTWRQLERLARDFYHRPTALFFLPAPPEEQTPTETFYRLPAKMLHDLEPDTWLAIRQARARQLDLEDLSPFDESRERQIVLDLGEGVTPDNIADFAMEVRRWLDFQLDDQLKCGSEQVALERWRNALQEAGVWVFKRYFKQHDVAGFCLYDRQLPLIYLNNAQSTGRQIFTLFHELAHLLFKFSYLERSDIGHYVDSLEGHDRDVEIACSRFAGEILIPTSHFLENTRFEQTAEPSDDFLTFVAHRYRVGREVVLRKCLDQKFIDQQYYNERIKEWRRIRLVESGRVGRGNYYTIQRGNLGTKYIGLAFRGFYQGAYEIDQLVEYLGVKPTNVVNLESWLHRRLAPR